MRFFFLLPATRVVSAASRALHACVCVKSEETKTQSLQSRQLSVLRAVFFPCCLMKTGLFCPESLFVKSIHRFSAHGKQRVAFLSLFLNFSIAQFGSRRQRYSIYTKNASFYQDRLGTNTGKRNPLSNIYIIYT